MHKLWLGLTDIYNLFHHTKLSPEIIAKVSKKDVPIAESGYADILHLRQLHVQLDQAVLAAYCWHEPGESGPAIVLRHDYYEVDYLPENDRVRYTIHPDARREILKQLLDLKHKWHDEEVKKGLWEKKKRKGEGRSVKDEAQEELEMEEESDK
jgi:hypothetical protein